MLSEINVSTDNKNLASLNGVLFSSDFKCLIRYPAAKKDKTYTVPDLVETLVERAFKDVYSLEEINLPKKLNYIENSCFYECKNLKSIILPDDIPILHDLTFKGCRNLEEIILPKNLKHICDFVFADCYNLKKITIPNSVKRISPNALMINGIKEIRISKKWAEENNFFVKMYDSLIKIEKSLDDVINEGKSFKEINNIYKDELIK